jgi:hypothetical protein
MMIKLIAGKCINFLLGKNHVTILLSDAYLEKEISNGLPPNNT